MSVPLRVYLALEPSGIGSRVLIDDLDVSSHCSGITVRADVESPTRVLLELIDVAVEAEGDVAAVLRGLRAGETL